MALPDQSVSILRRCKTMFSNSGLLSSFFLRLARTRRIVSRPCMRMSLHKGSNPRSRGQPRNHRSSSSSQFLCLWNTGTTSVLVRPIPLLHLKHKVGTTWEFSSNLAGVYLDILHEIATSGSTFGGKNALCTGVGKGPIGIEVVKGFLSGGARIVIITSSYNRKTVKYYQSIFQSLDSRGSASTVIPFIQASRQDVEALINYIYNKLNMGFDYIIPFTGISENGYKIHGLYDCSELAHCMMLVNLLRILGCCHKLHLAISPSILHLFSWSQWLRKALEKTFRSVPVTSRGDQ